MSVWILISCVCFVCFSGSSSADPDHDTSAFIRRLEALEETVVHLKEENSILRKKNEELQWVVKIPTKIKDKLLGLNGDLDLHQPNTDPSNSDTKTKFANNLRAEAKHQLVDDIIDNPSKKNGRLLTKNHITRRKRLLLGSPPATERVAFTASLAKTISNLGSHQAIDYDKVLVNDGNAYDSYHGHFVAKVRGIYMISASVLSSPRTQLALEVVRNGTRLFVVYADANSSDDYSSDSRTIVALLQVGEMVWVRVYPSYEGHSITGFPDDHWYNSFSGVLLYQL